MSWMLLIGAVLAGIGAFLIGWPAWTSYRARESRDMNAERYAAWRGRANEDRLTAREGLTGEERRTLWLAAALAAVAVACLIGFLLAS
jgi:hypothetical protein